VLSKHNTISILLITGKQHIHIFAAQQHATMKFVFTVLMLALTLNLNAQNHPFILKGTVVEESSQETLEYASIMVNDSSTGEMITGR